MSAPGGPGRVALPPSGGLRPSEVLKYLKAVGKDLGADLKILYYHALFFMAVDVEKMVSAALAKVDVPDIARCVEQFSKYKAENHGGVLIAPLPPQFVKEEQESDRPEANEGGNTKKRKKIKKNAMARRIDMAELGEQSFDRICSDTVDSIMVMITDSLKTCCTSCQAIWMTLRVGEVQRQMLEAYPLTSTQKIQSHHILPQAQ